jgi:beta-lactamase superfamily II metal-dependent hydrolase
VEPSGVPKKAEESGAKAGDDSKATPLTIHHVDVGNGNCTIIEFPNKLRPPVMIDCGGDQPKLPEAKQYIDGILAPYGPALSHLIFSHADKDHTNFTVAVLKGTRITGRIYLPSNEKLRFDKMTDAAWVTWYTDAKNVKNRGGCRPMYGPPGQSFLSGWHFD